MTDALGQLILGQAAPTEPPKSAFPNAYLENVFKQLMPKEGGRYDNPPHPLSSAQGAYGVTAPAYADIQKNDPYFANRPQNTLTPQEQDRAAVVLREKVQIPALRQFGVEPTEPNIQLSHFLGPAGAAQYLKNGYISPEAAAANGGMEKAQQIAKDRLAFGAKLAQSQQQTQNQAGNPPTPSQTAPQPTGDALGDMILGIAPAQPSQAATPAPAAAPEQAPVAEQPSAVSSAAQRRFALTPELQARGEEKIANAVGNVDAVLSMPAGLLKSLATAYMYLGEAAMPGAFPVEKREAIANEIGSALSPELAKRVGVDPNSKGYQEALLQKIGSLFDKGIDYASEKLGVNKSDLEAIVNLAPFMTPKGMIKGAPKTEPKPLVERVEPGFVPEQKPTTQLTPEQTTQIVQAKEAGATPEALQTMVDQFTAKKGAAEVPTTVATQLGQQLEAKQAPIKVPEENPPMPSAKPSASSVRERQNILDEVGINVHRKSALEGNPKEASSQYITAKADQGPYASGMTDQINFEKKALDTHFGKVAESAGGDVPRYGTPDQQGDLIKIGSKVKDALNEGYKAHVAEGKKLYQDAAAAHGDKPVAVDKFGDFLKADENFAYEKEKGLQSAVKTYMTRKGLMDKDGNVQPMTVADAEGVRQFINDKYNYETSGLISKMKRQIDDQVFEQVGGETYQRARAHWAKGKETYENPKAIGDLLSDRGVNEKIASEDVMNRVSGLKQKQFAHLVDTLRSDGQKAALDQIKTSLVDEIRRAGQSAVNEPFNSVKAAKTAAALGEKLKVAFADDPKALDAIYKGLEAANIVHIPTAYPGAAVQTNLLKNKFVDFAIRRTAGGAGATVGTFIAGPGGGAAGYAAGEYAGSKIVGSRINARQQKQLQKELTTAGETTSLGDILKFKPKKK